MSEPSGRLEQEPSAQPRVGQIVARVGGRLGRPEFSTGERAALRRLNPNDPGGHIGAVCRLLISAGFAVERASLDQLKRWAVVLHGMALMSGPDLDPHNPSIRVGDGLVNAGLSEQRFTRLLSARGPAFREQVPRLARFLAARHQSLDWLPLARLILYEELNREAAEDIRLRIASQYYSARAKAEKTETEGEAIP
jgi:CRISPR system Cascade subunit CasB